MQTFLSRSLTLINNDLWIIHQEPVINFIIIWSMVIKRLGAESHLRLALLPLKQKWVSTKVLYHFFDVDSVLLVIEYETLVLGIV